MDQYQGQEKMRYSMSRVCETTCRFSPHLTFARRYYEWQTKGKHKKPFFTKRNDGRLLLMAGLYDSVVLEGTRT